MANSDAMHAYLLSGQALRLAVMLGLHLLDETYDESLIRPVRHALSIRRATDIGLTDISAYWPGEFGRRSSF